MEAHTTAGSHQRNLLPRAVKIPSIKRTNPSIVFTTHLTLTDHTVPVSLAIQSSLFIIFSDDIFLLEKKVVLYDRKSVLFGVKMRESSIF